MYMYMKYKISDVTGYVQEVYSKCHMSLILEMCRTHGSFDTAGNVQEISYVSLLGIVHCEIFNILEMCKKCHVSLSWKCT